MTLQKETDVNYKNMLMNPGSERGILSVCLKNNSLLVELESSGIEPKHFGVGANRYIYIAMQYLFSKRQTPTAISINEVIASEKGKKALEELGGMEYIASLEEAYVSPDNLEIFCNKIKQAYARRNVYEMCMQTAQDMLDEKTETLNEIEIVGQVENRFNELSVNVVATDDAYKFGDDTDRILAIREENPAQIPGIETGWKEFDKLTGGFQPGDLAVLVARSKTGKSVTLVNWATSLAVIQNLPVLYIDTEMSSRQQEDRILARLAFIPHAEITSGLYALDTEYGTAQEKRERLNKAKQLLKGSNFFHIYMPDMSADKVKAIVKKYKMRHDICAVFFDYIKLTSNQAGSLRNAQEYQQLGFLTCALKELAGSLDIPIITACQENRADPKSTAKNETNVGGSDRILQNASKLMFLYNKPEEDIVLQGEQAGNQQLKIAFQRNGESDCKPINIHFNHPYIMQEEALIQ